MNFVREKSRHAENSDLRFMGDLQNFEMSSSSTTPATSTTATPSPAPQQEYLPNPTTLLHAARLAIQQDRAIQLDYYVESATAKAFIGEDPETKEKMLVKSNEEFTSLIGKIYKVQEDFIILTENSIYIVSGKIQKRRINATQMRSVEFETL
mgnify:CR=1 FL=1